MSRLFSRDGNVYRTTEVATGCLLVYAQVQDEEGGPYDGELRIVQESALFEEPPKRTLDDEIAKLHETRTDLRRQIGELRQELRTFEDDADGRVSRLKQHKGLERLEDFLAGRITHYIAHTYGPPTIVAFEDTKNPDGDYQWRDATKLLTLFGRSNGDLEWRLNRYTDGSGFNTTAIPCTSHNEAVKVAEKLFAEHAAKAASPDDRTPPQRTWVKRAAEYGITLPPEYLQQLEVIETTQKQAAVTKLEEQLAEARRTLGDD